MNKTIKILAIAALFIFPGLSGFPQEAQEEATKTVQAEMATEGNAVCFPILIGIP